MTVNTAFNIRRTDYDFGITYGSDTKLAMQVAVAAVKDIDGVLNDPAPEALSTNLGDFAKVVKLRWWTKSTRRDVVHVRSDVMLAVEAAFAENGIDIPFPTTTMLWHDQTGSEEGDRERA